MEPTQDDPLNAQSTSDFFWTTVNAGEAAPGVQTPLSLTAWQGAASAGFLAAGRALGVIRSDEDLPVAGVLGFYGRATLSVNFLQLLGDRMPGTTSEKIISGLVGHMPEGLTPAPTRRFYPSFLVNFPRTFAQVPRQLVVLSKSQDEWWRRTVPTVSDMDLPAVTHFLAEARERHLRATIAQCVAAFVGVQPVHDAIERIAAKFASDSSADLTAPVGGPEMGVILDIWRASRGWITVAEVARNQGFHGPFEGELSSRIWREEPRPLQAMVDRYADRPASESPLEHDEQRAALRRCAERELLAEVPIAARPAIRGILRLGRQRLHLRGVAKRSMLQGFDGIRAGARRLGLLLELDGVLDNNEDVFYLTIDEILQPQLTNCKDVVAWRRGRRNRHLQVSLPTIFAGDPTPIPNRDGPRESTATVIEGIGVSAGVAEGRARVVTDPAFDDVEDGEVLIAGTTDPSWCAIMFVSAALVVDIGGALSHAAVVARELQIPCVVNTRDGTDIIRTGDWVRVDGRAGTVEILKHRE